MNEVSLKLIDLLLKRRYAFAFILLTMCRLDFWLRLIYWTVFENSQFLWTKQQQFINIQNFPAQQSYSIDSFLYFTIQLHCFLFQFHFNIVGIDRSTDTLVLVFDVRLVNSYDWFLLFDCVLSFFQRYASVLFVLVDRQTTVETHVRAWHACVVQSINVIRWFGQWKMERFHCSSDLWSPSYGHRCHVEIYLQ